MSQAIENSPDIWRAAFPVLGDNVHKYKRGHCVILGAPELTGATRLAAGAASRIGAGLVTVLAPVRADIYRASLPADIMVREDGLDGLKSVTSILAGPGGLMPELQNVLTHADKDIRRVFDAGALPGSSDAGNFDPNCVLTPHQGEFARSFPDIQGSDAERAQKAARQSQAVIVLKGPCTVIAHPDGRTVINDRPNPYLAKAGTGDVLAGFIAGLLAQGMPVFEACCAAVWLHSEAGARLGIGLTACDLEAVIPKILREI